MKITKNQLKQIIKEELARVLTEGSNRSHYEGVDDNERYDVDITVEYDGSGNVTVEWKIDTERARNAYQGDRKIDTVTVAEDKEEDLLLTGLNKIYEESNDENLKQAIQRAVESFKAGEAGDY
jgi:hypothetical protein